MRRSQSTKRSSWSKASTWKRRWVRNWDRELHRSGKKRRSLALELFRLPTRVRLISKSQRPESHPWIYFDPIIIFTSTSSILPRTAWRTCHRSTSRTSQGTSKSGWRQQLMRFYTYNVFDAKHVFGFISAFALGWKRSGIHEGAVMLSHCSKKGPSASTLTVRLCLKLTLSSNVPSPKKGFWGRTPRN